MSSRSRLILKLVRENNEEYQSRLSNAWKLNDGQNVSEKVDIGAEQQSDKENISATNHEAPTNISENFVCNGVLEQDKIEENYTRLPLSETFENEKLTQGRYAATSICIENIYIEKEQNPTDILQMEYKQMEPHCSKQVSDNAILENDEFNEFAKYNEDDVKNYDFQEDSDDSIKDPNFNRSSSSDDSSDTSSEDEASHSLNKETVQPLPAEEVTEQMKGKKRKKNERAWQRNLSKKLRSEGKQYKSVSNSKKMVEARTLKPPCSVKCRLKGFNKINEADRKIIFTEYWRLGSLQRQRDLILSSISAIKPRYRYVREGSHRRPNNEFHLEINELNHTVCKLFFKNTLGINDRPIRTVIDKKLSFTNNIIAEDKRGRHGKQKTVDAAIKEGVRNHICSIPAIESHYTRANTTRMFIDGSKSIAEIHRDYVNDCIKRERPYANYLMFNRIFNNEFNISFFISKKDQCELCVAYSNAEGEEKENLKIKYEEHIAEKDLSRQEKQADKEKVEENVIVACYDLQAIFQCPRGDVSTFYYKSKLNVLDFTIYELKTNNVECFVWHKGEANRGVNEIGSCVLKYLRDKAINSNQELDITFYSDDCGGQQKNRFMFALYLYAVEELNIKSITHKYLIRGHTQNEGDSAHSLIEKQVKRSLKSGPIYTPDQFVTVIRAAKKNWNSL